MEERRSGAVGGVFLCEVRCDSWVDVHDADPKPCCFFDTFHHPGLVLLSFTRFLVSQISAFHMWLRSGRPSSTTSVRSLSVVDWLLLFYRSLSAKSEMKVHSTRLLYFECGAVCAKLPYLFLKVCGCLAGFCQGDMLTGSCYVVAYTLRSIEPTILSYLIHVFAEFIVHILSTTKSKDC